MLEYTMNLRNNEIQNRKWEKLNYSFHKPLLISTTCPPTFIE